MSQTPPIDDDRGGALGTSLLFWICLLIAGGVYAAVALSPRYLAQVRLEREFYNNQVALVALERQVQHLERVTKAFETDPQFAAEVARIELNAARPGNERIAVDNTLALDGAVDEAGLPKPIAALPWYAPLLQPLANHSSVRRALLAVASLLTLFAFAVLHDAPVIPGEPDTLPRSGLRGWLKQRYRQPEQNSGRRAA